MRFVIRSRFMVVIKDAALAIFLALIANRINV